MHRPPVPVRLRAATVVLALAPTLAAAQARPADDSARAAKRARKEQAALDRAVRGDTTGLTTPRLFADTGILHLTLTADFHRLAGDRQPTPSWRPARLAYVAAAGDTLSIPLQLRPRGIWRRNHCALPPLRLRFAHGRRQDTPFAKERSVKLVVHCRDDDEYEQYLLAEFQLYRVYNALTPMSPLVRLARVTYVDSSSGRAARLATRYAFFVEDPDAMATRNAAVRIRQQGARRGDLDPVSEAFVGLFEYFIGNTDFSIAGLHNVELLQRTMHYYGVVHDFDFSGAVNARYATVDPRLPIRGVRDRLYVGYCVDAEPLAAASAPFLSRKVVIYALYGDAYGRLLDPNRARATLEYFDDFYRVIADPRWAMREVQAGCLEQ